MAIIHENQFIINYSTYISLFFPRHVSFSLALCSYYKIKTISIDIQKVKQKSS